MATAADRTRCSRCNLPECDLKVIGCGCHLHATCLPLSLILDGNISATDNRKSPAARCDQGAMCPVCYSAIVKGIQVLPLTFDPLKRAIALRVAEAKLAKDSKRSRSSSSVSSDGENASRPKRELEPSDEILTAEAEQAVFSQGSNSDPEARRSGRWTDDEVIYSEELMKAFDNGQLPLAHGTKLASFLCDALQCKASRLTKKMKNAKLSIRSFEITHAILQKNATTSYGEPLSNLQARFVASLNSEYTQLELGFNLGVHWRTCISDLCVQVGYPFLDGSNFISSLEEYERLGESMRNVRRRRWGDICAVAPSITSSSSLTDVPRSPIHDIEGKLPVVYTDGKALTVYPDQTTGSTSDLIEYDIPEPEELLEQSFMGCFEEDTPPMPSKNNISSLSSQNPFMEVIADYLESQDLPFQHADTWVPSLVDGNKLALIHAGAVTRRDQDAQRWSALESFGEYSSKFSFAPGRGLVGRVFSSGKTMWEYGINKLDPEFFLRAGGAEEYGVRTAVGIPLSSSTGRMVVLLYSCNHIPEDLLLANQFERELSQYAPSPKWKLVVDIKKGPAPRRAEQESRGSRTDSPSSSQDFILGLNTAGGEKVGTQVPFVSPQLTPRSVSTAEQDENQIIALIGEHLVANGEGEFEDPETFQHLLKMRLMLLRPTNRRSVEENEIVEILRSSYKNYSSGGRFCKGDLVKLLAREWKCLLQFSVSLDHLVHKSPFAPDPLLVGTAGVYKRHDIPPDHAPVSAFKDTLAWDLAELQPRPLKTKDDSMIVYDHSLNAPRSAPTSRMFSQGIMNGMPRSISSSTGMSGCNSPSGVAVMKYPSLEVSSSFAGRR